MNLLYTQKGYPEKRNILYNKNVNFSQSIDVFKTICHLSFKILKTIPSWALNLYYNPFISNSKLLHFFNGICLSEQQWISTFETILPRLGKVPTWVEKKAIKKLAASNCIKLVALSNCTYNIQKHYLNQNWPEYSEIILNKTIVLHPPQPLLINNLNEKPSVKNGLVFTFVGNQFFSKGGKEILNVFKQLAQNGHYIQLNIVSNFSPDQYASNTTAKDIKLLKEQFSQIPDTIKILGPMPNKEVISLLKQSHVALLPTYADTYGYFVLEAQACGCPVVSTNIRALPEINNNECGWVIPVPKDKNGNGILKTSNDRETFSKIIEKNLCTIVNEIIKNPDIIAPKAKASIERIKKQHDPEKHALKLINIYSKTSIKNNNN